MSSQRPIQLRHRRRKKINTPQSGQTIRGLGTRRWQGRSNQPNGQRPRHKQSQPHSTKFARGSPNPAVDCDVLGGIGAAFRRERRSQPNATAYEVPATTKVEGPRSPSACSERSRGTSELSRSAGPSGPQLAVLKSGLEVHGAHATVATRHAGRSLLRLVGDDCLGGEEQRGDRRAVLQRRPGHLGGLDDALLDHVDVLAGRGVEAPARVERADLLHHDAALEAGVERDLLDRRLERDLHDASTGQLVTLEVDLVERGLRGEKQRDATTGEDTLLDCSLRVADRVLDAVLALLELHLGGSADLDDRNTAGQLGQALLQLLAVVVAVALLDLVLDLVDPAGDLVAVTGALDDRRLVLADDDLARLAEQVERGVLELEADLFADDLAAGEDGHVLQHRLAAVAEARRLDRNALEGAADLVDDQRREGLALDVLADDDELLAALHDLLEHRKQVLDGADLAVDEQDVGVVDDRFHPLRVGDEVRRDVALVEAHAFDELELEAEGVALLDGDDAFLADLVHRLGDDLADRGVAGGDGGRGSNLLLGLDVLGLLGQLLADALDGVLDAALQRHRVGAGGDVAQALADERLGEDGRGGRAVTSDVVGLLGDLFDELGADLLEGVLELDFLGDGHTVVGDRGGAPLLLQDDVATLRAERHLDGIGELVHATLEGATRLLVERDEFGHAVYSSR